MELWGDLRTPAGAIEAGIAAASWPARMQKLGQGALTRAFPELELWLDGGHNPHAARALAHVFEPPLTLVTAMMANKDHVGFFEAFRGVAGRVITIPNAKGHKGADPETLLEAARAAGLDATATANLDAALSLCPAGRVLICGSLYMAGEVLARNEEYPE